MPLASSLSASQKRADVAAAAAKQQARRFRLAGQKRRQSLPSTVPSSTVATTEKVERRLSLRRGSFSNNNNSHPLPPDSKENAASNNNNNKGCKSNDSDYTPPWHYSPPETRSAKKNKVDHHYYAKDGSNKKPRSHGVLLQFSPPNQRENEARERQRLEEQEAARDRRIAQARLNGQVMVFSPSHRAIELSEDNQSKNDNSSEAAAAVDADTTTSCLTESQSASSTNAANDRAHQELLLKVSQEMALLNQHHDEERSSRRLSNSDFVKEMHTMLVSTKEELQKTQASAAAGAATQLLEQTNEGLRADLRELTHTMMTGKEQHAMEATRLQGQLQQSLQTVEALEDAQTDLALQTATLQHDKTELAATVTTLEQDLRQARATLEETKERLASVQAERMAERDALEEQVEALTGDKDSVRSQWADVTKSNEVLEASVASYQTAMERLENVTIPDLEAAVAAERDRIAGLEKEVATTAAALHDTQQELNVVREELTQLQQTYEEQRQGFQRLSEHSHTALESMKEAATAKDEALVRLKQEFEEQVAELQAARDATAETATQMESIKETLAMDQKQLNDALEESMIQLDAVEKEKKVLEQKLSKVLQSMQAAAETAATKDSEQCAQLQALQAQVEEERQQREHTAAAQQAVEHQARAKDQRVVTLERDLEMMREERDQARCNMQGFNEREQDLYVKLRESDRIRRSQHAKIMQLMGNIRVFVRVRPALSHEAMTVDGTFSYPGVYDRKDTGKTTTNACSGDDLTKNGLIEVQEPYKDRGGLKDRRKKWRFGFDNVFSPTSNQEDIWEATEPLVQTAVDGHNVTCFAYGQTGSGKTYTMLGEDGKSGIIGRSVQKMFQEKDDLELLSQGDTQVSMSVELLEVYNEKVRDLLSSEKEQNLKVNSNEVVGNIKVATNTMEEVMQVIDLAQSRRCVKATGSNSVSSRSHMIFTLHFDVTTNDGSTDRVGKLNICDLAGSERLSKSGTNNVGGAILEESKNINKSLSVLSNVIERLQAGEKNIPFRESKLTFLLKNSLSGNSKTLAIVCCNPLSDHVSESMCSLRFAEKVNRVELKAANSFSC